MSGLPVRRNPAGGPGFKSSKGTTASTAAWALYRAPRLPRDWRERLPNPEPYYRAHVERLGKPNAQGWAQGRCPFHDDKQASLSVCLPGTRGGWRCFAGCGAGDMVAFHERVTGKPFAEAVRELLGLRP